jgi:hypothetical protein
MENPITSKICTIEEIRAEFARIMALHFRDKLEEKPHRLWSRHNKPNQF